MLNAAVSSKTYSNFAADIDLAAVTLPAPNASHKRGPCRRIRINSAGTGALALQYADQSTDTITGLVAGDVLDVQAAKILTTGTGIAGCTVFW